MAVDFETIFGSEVKVVIQARDSRRSFVGFPGAHGMASMSMGSCGYEIIISFRARATGANFAAAANLLFAIRTVEAYQWAAATAYTYKGVTHSNVVFNRLRMRSGADDKMSHMTSTHVFADGVMTVRSLI